MTTHKRFAGEVSKGILEFDPEQEKIHLTTQTRLTQTEISKKANTQTCFSFARKYGHLQNTGTVFPLQQKKKENRHKRVFVELLVGIQDTFISSFQ